jgi:dTDP-glucose 4,6-dehydratase
MSFYKAYGFPVVFTRAANVYGPGQQLYRIIPRAMLYARLGKKMQLHGGGYSVRSFIHMDDVSNATWRIAVNGIAGSSYHISTRDTVTIRELVEQICELTGVDFNSLAEVTDDRLGKDQAYLLESSKLRNELGWKDTVSLQKGLSETLTWIDTNLEILKKLPADYIHKP